MNLLLEIILYEYESKYMKAKGGFSPGWVGSVPLTLAFGAAPLSTVTHYKLGTRMTVLGGLVLTVVGLSASCFSSQAWHVLLSYGLVAGLGFSFIINAPFILLDEYFPYSHPRHVLTTSIAACGLPLGKCKL